MKKTILFSMALSLATFSVYADDAATTQKKIDEATAPAKSRKKKAQMCKECGKPEAQCECKGEGHGEHKDEKTSG